MKTKSRFFTGIVLFAIFSFFSCNRSNNTQSLELVGIWVMTVTENNQEESSVKSDTTFNSLFNGLKYIPNNSEWNFINDSVMILSRLNDSVYKPDTVFYKINYSGNSLIILSENDELNYPIRILDPNQIELGLGDKTVTCKLTKKQ
jgi:hypothetical protein